MAYDDGWQIHCVKCGEWIMDFEAVARWNKQRTEIERLRALVAEYDYRRGLNLTDLATLQSELRAATQENERLRSWAAVLGCGCGVRGSSCRWPTPCAAASMGGRHDFRLTP